ncbi:MAG: site-specific integrase [Candidatus Scalindua sp.]|nr:site-specific integrase [Candidatus Scalindua sp.]
MRIPQVKVKKINRKSGIIYQLDYTVDGKRIRTSVGPRKYEAEIIAAKLNADFALGQFGIENVKQKSTQLAQLLTEYLFSKKNIIRPSSEIRYKNYLTQFEQFISINFPQCALDISKISEHHIRLCINHLLEDPIKGDKPWSKRTVNDFIIALRMLFKYALKQKYLNSNPALEIEKIPCNPSTDAPFYDDKELEIIFKHIDPFWSDFFNFLLYTGLRKGELINLKWENIDLEPGNEKIHIRAVGDWKTKTGRQRTLPLHKKAIELVSVQKTIKQDYLFISKTGVIIHPDRPYHALKAVLKTFKIEGDVHKFRHTFASRLVMAGASLFDVKELLGHTDIQSTMVYAHLSQGHMRKIVNMMY